MSRKNKNIDDIFKDRLSDYEASGPPPGDWSELEAKLNQKVSPVSFLNKWGLFLSSVIIIIGLTLFFFLYTSNNTGIAPHQKNLSSSEGTASLEENAQDPNSGSGLATTQTPDSLTKTPGTATTAGEKKKTSTITFSNTSRPPETSSSEFRPKSRMQDAGSNIRNKKRKAKPAVQANNITGKSNRKGPPKSASAPEAREPSVSTPLTADPPALSPGVSAEQRTSPSDQADSPPSAAPADTLTRQDSLQAAKNQENAAVPPMNNPAKDSTLVYSFDPIRFFDNPAYTGLSVKNSATVRYRNQWPQSTEGSVSYLAGYDTRLGDFGLGGYYLYSQEAFSTADRGAVSLAYHKKYKDFFRFSAAVSTYIKKTSFLESAAQPADMNDPAFSDPDKTLTGFNTALTFAWKGLFISGSMQHGEKETLLYSGYKHSFSEKLSATAMLEMKQDIILTSWTPSVYLTNRHIIAGVSYPNMNSLNIHLGWMMKRWYGLVSSGYVTDNSLRKYGNISSLELILNYRF